MFICSVGALLALVVLFFFNDTATTEIYTLSLHDALPISFAASSISMHGSQRCASRRHASEGFASRSEEHTSELQSRLHLVCRLLLEKKKILPYYAQSFGARGLLF